MKYGLLPLLCSALLRAIVIRMLFGAKWADSRSLGKIPSTDAAIFDRCKKDAGFVPFFVRKMEHPAAKKAFAFAFILRMNQGSEEVPAALKQVRV